MQVKKFEARSMKEAIEMVKTQLGPDAIILSARDNQKRFGLVGEGSVEITAAVSDETLHRKKFAESRLREQDKDKLARSSARIQKQVIGKMIDRYQTQEKEKERESEKVFKPITRTKYIEIDDSSREDFFFGDSAPVAQKGNAKSSEHQMRAEVPDSRNHVEDPSKVRALKNEIEELKKIISQFQSGPQKVSQFPGSIYGLSYETSSVFERLTGEGIAEDLTANLLLMAQNEMSPLKLKNKALVEAFVARKILDEAQISNPKIRAQVQCFVGPSGSGKTSTLIKLASHLVVNEKKNVGIVTTDNLKVGSVDQMRIYCQILNVPFATIKSKIDWPRVMSQFSNCDFILVDFAGLSLKSMEEVATIRQLLPSDALKAQIHLVLNCLAKDSDLTELGRRYQVTGFHDVIFTCLDESVSHGTIYNFMKRFNIPLHSFGVGSRVPEDYELATRERLLDLIFKITRIQKNQRNEGLSL